MRNHRVNAAMGKWRGVSNENCTATFVCGTPSAVLSVALSRPPVIGVQPGAVTLFSSSFLARVNFFCVFDRLQWRSHSAATSLVVLTRHRLGERKSFIPRALAPQASAGLRAARAKMTDDVGPLIELEHLPPCATPHLRRKSAVSCKYTCVLLLSVHGICCTRLA